MYTDANIVVYTAIFGSYDVLIDPDVVEPDIDYICFTDNAEIESDIWDIRVVDIEHDDALSNRKIKILAHDYLKKYDVSVYVDGNIQLRDQIRPLVDRYLSTVDFAVYKHPQRDSLFEEAQACMSLNKADESTIQTHIESYRKEGFPDNLGLSENRILFRRHHNPDVRAVMERWWTEVSTKAPRDQLSLMYSLWKSERIEFRIINQSVDEAPQYTIHPHRPDGFINYIWPYWLHIRAQKEVNLAFKTLFHIGVSFQIIKNQGLVIFVYTIYAFLSRTVQKQIGVEENQPQ